MDKEIKAGSSALYNTLYFFFIISMLIVGYGTLQIITFAIEDQFNQPVNQGWIRIWGPDYARSISWIVLAGIVAIPLAILHKRLSLKQTALYFSVFRSRLLGAALILGFTTAFFYILVVTYSFFAGKSDPVGLYRIASTLSIIAIGLMFVWFERKSSANLKLSGYLAVFAVFLLGLSGTGSVLTMKYAPPAKVRLVDADLQKIEKLEGLAIRTKTYFATHNKLPTSIEDLVKSYDVVAGPLPKSKYAEIEYTKLSDAKFKLCANFDTSYEEARRIRTRFYDRYYSIGKRCPVFTLTKKKSDIVINVMNNNKIKIIVY